MPAENLLGKEGRGFYAIMSNFQNERTVIGAMAMGEAQAALELTLDYVTTRKAFGAHAVREAGASASASRCSPPRSRPGGSSSITPPGSTRRASTARARSRW